MSDLKDPRVFFAAERTLLAWSRTGLALIAFGFIVERAGLLLALLAPAGNASDQSPALFWLGLGFLFAGAIATALSALQYRGVLRTLNPDEIPRGYGVWLAPVTSLVVAALGVAMAVYLLLQGV